MRSTRPAVDVSFSRQDPPFEIGQIVEVIQGKYVRFYGRVVGYNLNRNSEGLITRIVYQVMTDAGTKWVDPLEFSIRPLGSAVRRAWS